MRAIKQLIMNKKFLPVFLVLVVASFIFAFQSLGFNDNPKSKNERILRTVGLLLEQGHYNPKAINDAFSKDVLKRFIKELDEDKSLFLKKDIDSFRRFEANIDDEIHGSKLESFYFIMDSYTRRLNEVSGYYSDILAKPFDFVKDEEVVLDGDKLNFATSEKDRRELWRKRLKYMTLTRYYDLLEEREKNSHSTDTA